MNQNNKSQLTHTSRSLPISLLLTREAVMKNIRPILQKQGLTDQQWRVLRVIQENDGTLGASVIASRSCLLAPSLTRILSTLTKKGFVQISKNPRDTRRMLIQLTNEGESMITKIATEIVDASVQFRNIVGAKRWEALVNELIAVREIISSSKQLDNK